MPICLGGVFRVALGGHGACDSGAELLECVLETQYETIVDGFREPDSHMSHSPCLHQGEDEVRPDHSFEFQLLYNAVLCTRVLHSTM